MKVSMGDSLNIASQVTAIPPVSKAPYQPNEQKEQSGNDEAKAQKSVSSDQVSVNIQVSRNTLDMIRRLGDVSEFLNTTAQKLHETESGLSSSSDLMVRMKTELQKIIKNFPPFPIDSKEREQILMSYNALQKEILKMMVPPPPQPVYERVKHLWQNLFNVDESRISAPELPVNAPDSHVKAAYQSLEGSISQISAIRSDMSQSSSLAV